MGESSTKYTFYWIYGCHSKDNATIHHRLCRCSASLLNCKHMTMFKCRFQLHNQCLTAHRSSIHTRTKGTENKNHKTNKSDSVYRNVKPQIPVRFHVHKQVSGYLDRSRLNSSGRQLRRSTRSTCNTGTQIRIIRSLKKKTNSTKAKLKSAYLTLRES